MYGSITFCYLCSSLYHSIGFRTRFVDRFYIFVSCGAKDIVYQIDIRKSIQFQVNWLHGMLEMYSYIQHSENAQRNSSTAAFLFSHCTQHTLFPYVRRDRKTWLEVKRYQIGRKRKLRRKIWCFFCLCSLLYGTEWDFKKGPSLMWINWI